MSHRRNSVPSDHPPCKDEASVSSSKDRDHAFDRSDNARPPFVPQYTGDNMTLFQHSESQDCHAGQRAELIYSPRQYSLPRSVAQSPFGEYSYASALEIRSACQSSSQSDSQSSSRSGSLASSRSASRSCGTSAHTDSTAFTIQRCSEPKEELNHTGPSLENAPTDYAPIGSSGHVDHERSFAWYSDQRYREPNGSSVAPLQEATSIYKHLSSSESPPVPRTEYTVSNSGGIAKNRYTAEENLFILKARQEPYKIPWRVVPDISAKWYSAGRGRNGRNMQVHYSQNVNPRVSSLDELTPEIRQFLKDCINSKLQVFYKGVREELMKLGSCDDQLSTSAVAFSLRIWMKYLREKLAKSLLDASRLKSIRSRQKPK